MKYLNRAPIDHKFIPFNDEEMQQVHELMEHEKNVDIPARYNDGIDYPAHPKTWQECRAGRCMQYKNLRNYFAKTGLQYCISCHREV